MVRLSRRHDLLGDARRRPDEIDGDRAAARCPDHARSRPVAIDGSGPAVLRRHVDGKVTGDDGGVDPAGVGDDGCSMLDVDSIGVVSSFVVGVLLEGDGADTVVSLDSAPAGGTWLHPATATRLNRATARPILRFTSHAARRRSGSTRTAGGRQPPGSGGWDRSRSPAATSPLPCAAPLRFSSGLGSLLLQLPESKVSG